MNVNKSPIIVNLFYVIPRFIQQTAFVSSVSEV